MEIPGSLSPQAASTAAANGTEALAQLGDDYTTFLRLLTAQISNQDPLEPIDSTTFVTQLAQLTQVEQAAQTNANLANLSAQLDNLALTSSASVLGQEANVLSNKFVLTQDGAEATYKLETSAETVMAEIYGPTGLLIKSIEGLPAQAGTEHALSWDGRTDTNQQALLGAYTVRLVALDAGNAPIPVELYRNAKITAVDLSSGQLSYLVEGDELLPASNLRSIR